MALGYVSTIHFSYARNKADDSTYIDWFYSVNPYFMGFKKQKEKNEMKRVFGTIEVIFDLTYLSLAFSIGVFLLFSSLNNFTRLLAGLMALVLSIGDSLHLIPRILVIKNHHEELYRGLLGHGKQITSITMTIFYLFLWHIGLSIYSLETYELWSYLLYLLASIRIILCLFPQNRWTDRYPPLPWSIFRNIPFFAIGIIVGIVFFINSNTIPYFNYAWLAISLSFMFYLPVVLWSNKNPKIGMLMLPKTICYLWILIMCLSI